MRKIHVSTQTLLVDKSLCVVEDDFTYLQAMCLGKPVISTQCKYEDGYMKKRQLIESDRGVGMLQSKGYLASGAVSRSGKH